MQDGQQDGKNPALPWSTVIPLDDLSAEIIQQAQCHYSLSRSTVSLSNPCFIILHVNQLSTFPGSLSGVAQQFIISQLVCTIARTKHVGIEQEKKLKWNLFMLESI